MITFFKFVDSFLDDFKRGKEDGVDDAGSTHRHTKSYESVNFRPFVLFPEEITELWHMGNTDLDTFVD